MFVLSSQTVPSSTSGHGSNKQKCFFANLASASSYTGSLYRSSLSSLNTSSLTGNALNKGNISLSNTAALLGEFAITSLLRPFGLLEEYVLAKMPPQLWPCRKNPFSLTPRSSIRRSSCAQKRSNVQKDGSSAFRAGVKIAHSQPGRSGSKGCLRRREALRGDIGLRSQRRGRHGERLEGVRIVCRRRFCRRW
jgi:hypothetical protein